MKRRFAAIIMSAVMLLILSACAEDYITQNTSSTQTGTDNYTETDTTQNTSSTQTGTNNYTETGITTGSGVWLPDPYSVFGVDGEYYGTNTEDNGVTYVSYLYTFKTDTDTMGKMLVTYSEALKNIGFSHKAIKNPDGAVKSYKYTKDGSQGAELYIFVSKNNDTTNTIGDVEWLALLCVPTDMSFKPGEGAPGVIGANTVCISCHGTKKCSDCGGLGQIKIGSNRQDCPSCDTSGICSICDGLGYY